MRARCLILPLLLGLAAGPARAEQEIGPLLQRGIGLMRHGGAVAAPPGTPAPVRGCEASAVLTPIGREEMRRWGARLREAGAPDMRLLASRQCSAVETALLLGLGPVETDPALDPAGAAEAEARAAQLRALLLGALRSREAGLEPVLFVTHRANIAALTGLDPAHGEVMVFGAGPGGALVLLGRLQME